MSNSITRRKLVHWAIIAVALLLAILLGWTGGHRETATPGEATVGSGPRSDGGTRSGGADFDFYVLALSWSPAFCATDAGQRTPSQCGPQADFGFITHGLWPQLEEGWPSFCQSPHGQTVAPAVAQSLLPIMPDEGLIAHQWDKHGTCSGLSQADYARTILQARQSITIPALFGQASEQRLDAEAIENAFMQANSTIPRDGIALTCPNARFAEVRICLDRDLAPRACRQVDRNGCAQDGLFVAPR